MTPDRTGDRWRYIPLSASRTCRSRPPTPDVVVVDVLTASTSVVALLDESVCYVRPFADADAARAFGREHEDAVLGFDSTRTVPRLRDGVFVSDRSDSTRSSQ